MTRFRSHDDWLSSSNVNDTSKTINQKIKTDFKVQPNPDLNDNLPVWLGGSGSLPETKVQAQLSTQSRPVETIEKLPVEELKPASKPEKTSKTPEENVVETLKEVITSGSNQSQQTAVALQRTEVQLLAALELQTTQNSMAAVCARQRNILDSQERQLAQLVRRQTDRQAEVEKQLVTQQQRIQQLLEVFAMNTSLSQGDSYLQSQQPEEVATKSWEDKNAISILEEEVKKTNLENEELRMRISFTEKQFKFEFESLQSQHRREIEFLENQLSKKDKLFDQLTNDCKERISRFKEDEATLVAQHNERVQRLKDERAEDMKQLVEFHKITMDQVIAFNKLVPSHVREATQLSSETWKPSDSNQLSEKEQELVMKEKTMSALRDKFEKQREVFEKQKEEIEERLEQEKAANEDLARQLKQEQSQLKYKQLQLVQEKKHIEEQYYVQRKMLEEMQEKLMSDQTRLTTEQLTLAEERAKLDALANLQGLSGAVSFDMLQAKAEVQGSMEAARSAEIQAVEERRRLKEKERALDTERWKLQEMEEDLVARAQHLDRLMQISEANNEAGHKALEEAKQMEKKADDKLHEVERKKGDLQEKEQHLMRIKLEIAQEEIRISRKRQQLEYILPPLSSDEALSLQPIKGIIDPKMLILKLRAERELEVTTKPKPSPTNET